MSAVDILRQAEDLKTAVADTSRGANEAWVSRQALQDIYQKLLVIDLEFALDKKVEQDLWNHAFKNQISTLQNQTKDKQNAKRAEVQASLNLFLETASGFYLQLLQEMCSAFCLDLPFRRKAARIGIIKEYGPIVSKIKVPKNSSCMYICQHCLVHLGDIARYRQQVDQAQAYYRQAARLVPYNGQPYNQLAILEAAKGNKLSTVFYYIRSIAVKHPFPVATTNLEKFYLKISKDGHEYRQKLSKIEIVSVFLQLHALVHLGTDLPKARSNCEKILGSFPSHVSSLSFSAYQLLQMICINLYALYNLRRKQELTARGTDEQPAMPRLETTPADQTKCQHQPFYDLVLDLTVAVFDLLLTLTPKQELKVRESHTLSALKILLDWLRSDPDCLTSQTLKNSIIWSNLSRLLNACQTSAVQNDVETSCVGDDLHKYVTVPLPEDQELQCFLPLHKTLSELDFSSSTTFPDDVETRLRCHRLLRSGVWLVDEFPSLNLLSVQRLPCGRLQFSAPSRGTPGGSGESVPDRRMLRQNVAIQAIMQKKDTEVAIMDRVDSDNVQTAARREASKMSKSDKNYTVSSDTRGEIGLMTKRDSGESTGTMDGTANLRQEWPSLQDSLVVSGARQDIFGKRLPLTATSDKNSTTCPESTVWQETGFDGRLRMSVNNPVNGVVGGGAMPPGNVMQRSPRPFGANVSSDTLGKVSVPGQENRATFGVMQPSLNTFAERPFVSTGFVPSSTPGQNLFERPQAADFVAHPPMGHFRNPPDPAIHPMLAQMMLSARAAQPHMPTSSFADASGRHLFADSVLPAGRPDDLMRGMQNAIMPVSSSSVANQFGISGDQSNALPALQSEAFFDLRNFPPPSLGTNVPTTQNTPIRPPLPFMHYPPPTLPRPQLNSVPISSNNSADMFPYANNMAPFQHQTRSRNPAFLGSNGLFSVGNLFSSGVENTARPDNISGIGIGRSPLQFALPNTSEAFAGSSVVGGTPAVPSQHPFMLLDTAQSSRQQRNLENLSAASKQHALLAPTSTRYNDDLEKLLQSIPGLQHVPKPDSPPATNAHLSSLFCTPAVSRPDLSATPNTYSLFGQSPWPLGIGQDTSNVALSSSPFGSSTSSVRTTPDPCSSDERSSVASGSYTGPSYYNVCPPTNSDDRTTNYSASFYSSLAPAIGDEEAGVVGASFVNSRASYSGPSSTNVEGPWNSQGNKTSNVNMLTNNMQSLWTSGPSPLEKLLEQQKQMRHNEPH